MELPRLLTAKVSEKEYLNARTLFCKFKLVTPSQLIFNAGQFINLNVLENKYRSYSICSDSQITDEISIVATVEHTGIGANFLKAARIGQDVKLIGPSGRFVLPTILANDLVFIATGTGIAPFISMFHQLNHLKYEGKVTLFFGVRNQDELFFLDRLDYFKTTLKSFNYRLCLSNPTGHWPEKAGRVTELLDVENYENKQFFLCGNPYMIEEMLTILVGKGVSTENIFHEKFIVSAKNQQPAAYAAGLL